MADLEFGFTVDTHLFRELGELLVGRDSTALVELIKNAYDADATQVVVNAEGLLSNDGTITVTDNGVGMSPEVFNSAFLRIAGRSKEQGNRKSSRFGRRYTGAKGVGRLSAHKLARILEVVSTPASEILTNEEDRQGVKARIDWWAIERDSTTVDDVGPNLQVESYTPSPDQPSGTRMALKGVRNRWTRTKLSKFVQQVASCLAPAQFLDPPPFATSSGEASLGKIEPWTRSKKDPGFELQFTGDLDIGDDLWLQLVEQSLWLLEIEATAEGVYFRITPTPAQLKDIPEARSYTLRRDHPHPDAGPYFVARIYARGGRAVGPSATSVDQYSGIRIYQEGFRVIPYGEPHDDWLGLNRDYTRRVRGFNIPLDSKSSQLLPEVEGESYKIRGSRQYLGGVFLTAEGGASLRPVVNREGFLQDDAFEALRAMVRNGVDLMTRAQAAAEAPRGRRQTTTADTPHVPKQPPSGANVLPDPPTAEPEETTPRENLKIALTRARNELTQFRETISIQGSSTDQIEALTEAVDIAQQTASEEEADYAMLQVLASVGLQFASFVHEVNGLLSQAQQLRDLAQLLPTNGNTTVNSSIARGLRNGTEILCQSLTRQTSYLTEVVGPDARRRRRSIPLSEAPKTSLQLLASAIAERGIEVTEELDDGVKTPPIFPAELTIIFTNLLTNAIKAVGNGGRVLIWGKHAIDGGVDFRVENTGDAVDIDDSERWFTPFESTTTEVDVLLGQGMGLGLPITRRIVTDYAGSITFVSPSPGYSTAVQFNLPPRKGKR